MVARYYLEETLKPSGEKTFAVLSTVMYQWQDHENALNSCST